MAEENAEETKEPAAAAPAEAPAAAAAPAGGEASEGEKKNKKINKMGLPEVEAAIKKTEEHMGGLTSKYARALQARKEELSA